MLGDIKNSVSIGSSEKTKRETEIDKEFEHLSLVINLLKQHIENLIMRLNPVLGPRPENDQDKEAQSQPETEMGKRIRSITEELKYCNDSIETIIRSLEI